MAAQDDSWAQEVTPENLNRMDQNSRRQLQAAINSEQQKMEVQSVVHSLADACWTKCFSGTKITGGKLSGSEESCMRNCAERFVDVNMTVLEHLEKMRGQQ